MLAKTPLTVNRFGGTAEEYKRLADLFEAAVLQFFGVIITPWQREIAEEVLYRVLLRRRHTIVISVCRQVGKTEVICYLIWFLSYVFPAIVGERFKAVITAPERGTGSEVYDRSKMLYDTCEARWPEQFKFKQKNLDALILPDGTRLDVFGLFKTFAKREDKKSTKEGRTYHVAIRDEMHLGDDAIFKDEIEPALSTTGGVDIWIGNGGYRQCRAKELCETTGRADITVFKWDYDIMRPRVQGEYERTGNEMFMRWILSQDKYINDNGRDSDEVKKNLYLQWLVTVGNFVDYDRFISLRRPGAIELLCPTADAGLDFGKDGDESICTITDYERNIRDWGYFKGEYTDQAEEAALWLMQRAEALNLDIRNLICDSTGVGDPVVSMLRRILRIPVTGIKFTPQNKDKLAKKGIKSIAAKDAAERMSYPHEHPLRPKFEQQWKELEKARDETTGLIKYGHPKRHNAHDDFPDSYLLSIWYMENIEQVNVYARNTIG